MALEGPAPALAVGEGDQLAAQHAELTLEMLDLTQGDLDGLAPPRG